MEKNIKKVIWLVIVLVMGTSTIVGAATIFRSEDITYSSPTNKANVKDSLDELYDLTTNYEFYKPLADQVELGDYISMTPTSTSYTLSNDLSGCDGTEKTCAQNTINPSELNLWRVIEKNDDGTIDVVSEYVSSEGIYFYGRTGYMNAVDALNMIAMQYTDGMHVVGTRHMGFSDQILKCSEFVSCPNDDGFRKDYEMVKKVLGTAIGRKTTGENTTYWLASRAADGVSYGPKQVVESGGSYDGHINAFWLYNVNVSDVKRVFSVRPILILRPDNAIKSGDGKSAETAYTFE